jgi:adenylylsulfate kinase
MILLICGLSGAGKTTLAGHIKSRLNDEEIAVELIDADIYRRRFFTDLGFSRADRFENIRRLGLIANKFSSHHIVTIISAIAPYEEMRRELVAAYDNVKIVHVDCTMDILIKRDTKGLYKKALLPDGHPDKLQNLTGVNDPFEAPQSPDLYVNTSKSGISTNADEIYEFIVQHIQKERYGIANYANVPNDFGV